jgi:DNA adenine methylase
LHVKTSTARSPFPWFGGKQKLADRLISLFPPHDVYVEVFGGGGSVLLSKPPATLDVYNDRDDGLVSFFRALRDHPEELVALLELTPYARSEWQLCRETWRDPSLSEVERARRWYVVASQSFGGMVARGREGWGATPHVGTSGWKGDRHPNGERHHGRGWGGERLGRMHLSRAASTANRIDNIWRFVERMRLVQIEKLEWRDCLERYDAPGSVFYLDPPYVPSTRRSGGYNHELSEDDHRDLIARVLSLEGAAVVSGYDHPIYEPLVDAGFRRWEFEVRCSAARRHVDEAREARTEVVWASPDAGPLTLFEGVG